MTARIVLLFVVNLEAETMIMTILTRNANQITSTYIQLKLSLQNK